MVLLAFQEKVQLLPDFSLFIHIAMILGMIWLLNRTFFRPINRILESREDNKGGHSSAAEEILSRVAEKEIDYNAGLLVARNEGYKLIEKERNTAMNLKREKVAGAKNEVAKHLETELADLDRQTAKAETAIRKEADKMAEKISSNLLKVA